MPRRLNASTRFVLIFICDMFPTRPQPPCSANFLLDSCVERLHYKLEYADKDIGVLLVRGENVVALGEIDLIAEDMVPLVEVGLKEIEEKINAETKRRERDQIVREKVLSTMGFVNEGREGDAYY
nr:uncharacterized protein CI109_007278 [Kwoniella shandongensis]KAA5524402.1 hypothetical protein CI109_007278 [Kwoniella shandongensis]